MHVFRINLHRSDVIYSNRKTNIYIYIYIYIHIDRERKREWERKRVPGWDGARESWSKSILAVLVCGIGQEGCTLP